MPDRSARSNKDASGPKPEFATFADFKTGLLVPP